MVRHADICDYPFQTVFVLSQEIGESSDEFQMNSSKVNLKWISKISLLQCNTKRKHKNISQTE